MSDLKKLHDAEVLRLTRTVQLNARLAGVELDPVTATGLVRDVLDNYKPVGVWSEVPEVDQPNVGWFRPGIWERWDILIGGQHFRYKACTHFEFRNDKEYRSHIKRQIRIKMGESISAWIMEEAEPNPVNDRGEGTELL